MNAFTAGMWKAVPRAAGRGRCRSGHPRHRAARARERAPSPPAPTFPSSTARAPAMPRRPMTPSTTQPSAPSANAPSRRIAMIHGFCLGGGLAIALCTDIRLADENAEFAIPAAKLGLGYNARWVRPLLAAVPPAKAKEMLFTGRRFKVAEAQAMGLVNAVVPAAELEARTLALAEEIAANAPLTVRAAKRTIDELVRNPADARPRSARCGGRCLLSERGLRRRAARLQREAQAALPRSLISRPRAPRDRAPCRREFRAPAPRHRRADASPSSLRARRDRDRWQGAPTLARASPAEP